MRIGREKTKLRERMSKSEEVPTKLFDAWSKTITVRFIWWSAFMGYVILQRQL